MVRVAATVDALLAGCESRKPYKTADSLSGSTLEQVRIGGEAFVLKWLDPRRDWLMRAVGDDGTRQARLWGSGLLDTLPSNIDPVIVGVATEEREDGMVSALLMRDVASCMVDTSRSLTEARHRRFLTAMARMHRTYWGLEDDRGLIPLESHYTMLSPATAAREIAAGTIGVPQAVGPGWDALVAHHPHAGGLARSLALDPGPLVEALQRTPQTLIHGDWKLGNLGEHPDGRTVLLDWDRCGRGPAALDLAWYLAVNCDLLPESKEDAIAFYAAALAESIELGAWWDVQLRLGLLGAFVQLGWSKTGGDEGELRWWEERALDAESLLG
jgi:hypothetical protein